MKRTTGEWVGKAEDDYRGAIRLESAKPPLNDLVCFHCQQCVEKFIKGMLEELGISIPKTHDLLHLYGLLAAPLLLPNSFRRGLDFLSSFAVGVRYPNVTTTKRRASAALRWASKIRTTVRQLLGLP